ncbi:hypothetical protein HID58_025512 [Brassica napus]|uniref:Uncharacterized protein n=1 Tax=Brassica napus TaxID=3708 RepID=A0ABQ8CLB4_BRANA|nr:hypothetical protein HID58_025512 [Brassica napus]
MVGQLFSFVSINSSDNLKIGCIVNRKMDTKINMTFTKIQNRMITIILLCLLVSSSSEAAPQTQLAIPLEPTGEWLDKHPEYFSNPFYVAGNSYSGKPLFKKSQMSMKKSCRGNYLNTDPQNTECLKLVEDFNRSVSKIYEELILESNCDATSPDCYTYRYTLSEYCANKESVSRALRVKGTTARWERCNYNVQCNKNIKSSIPHIEGYRSLIFGYTKTYANKMTFATMKGGGHTLEYKPVESSILFERCFVITLNTQTKMEFWILKLLLPQFLLVLIQHADASSIIKYLPGFEGPLPFQLETGYIGVGEVEEDQMFYYFIKSERNPEEDPLLVWLTGGPGCSSFSGLVYENGPLAFKVEAYDGSIPTLVSTTYSWTKVANIIYLDQPVGTGFSYSRNPLADIPSDTGSAKRVDEFLRKWLDKHPEYFSNPFYVTGNSYSGKGYVLGNPVTNFDIDNNTRIPFAHGMALISDELYESMKKRCGGNYFNVDPQNTECLELVKDYKKSVSRIYEELILQSNCDKTSPDCYTYWYSLSEYWANNESVRRALRVVKGTTGEWDRCNWNVQCNQDIKSSIPYHMNNSIKGYRSLILSGDHDMTIPFVGTQDWIRSLNFSIVEKWRPWMVNDQVAGYTKTYANKMTFATVKGGGHTLEYKPVESSILFERWISGQPL